MPANTAIPSITWPIVKRRTSSKTSAVRRTNDFIVIGSGRKNQRGPSGGKLRDKPTRSRRERLSQIDPGGRCSWGR